MIRFLAPSLAALFAVSPAATAQWPEIHPHPNPQVRAILADLGRVRQVDSPSIAPDGSRLAWQETAPDGLARVLVGDGQGRHPRALPMPAGCQARAPLFAPDSRRLLVMGECGGTRQTDLFLSDGDGKPVQISHLQGFVQSAAWAPDGRSIAFLYVPGATRPAGALAAMKPPSGVIGVEGLEVQRVAVVPAEGGETRLLSPPGLHVYEFDWSPRGTGLAYVAAPPPGENNWWIARLYTQGTEPGAAPALLVDPAKLPAPAVPGRSVPGQSVHGQPGLQMAVPRWSPDGSRISFIAGLMSDQGSTGGDVYVVPSAWGTAVDMTPEAKVTAVWPHWIDSETMVVSEIAGGSIRITRYRVTPGQSAAAAQSRAQAGPMPTGSGPGSAAPATVEQPRLTDATVLLESASSIGDGRAPLGLSIDRRGRFAVAGSSFSRAPEIYLGELRPGARLEPVTHVNDALRPSWGRAESIEWTNEGLAIQGWLMLPAHYDPSRRYPLVVMVHGGPASAVLPRWPSAAFGGAPLSALDYFVLEPNPRGSYGQGERFTVANRRDFGYGDLRDILAGVDAVERRYPAVDEGRLGLTGWSYGGFMTMFGVTQTRRFRAAVAGAGISDWLSYYGENSIDQWMIPYFGASVYDDPQAYARSSAIGFVRNVRTPTLIVVGDRDGECPAPQSFEFWHALRDLGVPTELVVYPDEGHGFRDPEHKADVLERSLDWFDHYLGGPGR